MYKSKEDKEREKKERKFQKQIEYRNNSRERQILRMKQKQAERKENGEAPKIKKINKFSEKMKVMHEKDALFYEEIWNERPHYCVNCKSFLGHTFKLEDGKLINLFRYAHIIPKSIYPFLRHYKGNLMLLCLRCHTKFDNSPKEVIEKMSCYDAKYIQELKELHKELEKNNDERYK